MINNISVIGAGTMGYGIALNFALYGMPVRVFESNAATRSSVKARMTDALNFFVEEAYITSDKIASTLENVQVYDDLKRAVENADYVIEATFEDLALKQTLFADLDSYCKPEAILASNTSSLALGSMLEKLPEARKAKCMVSHWYNPPHIMPLVELSYFGNMKEEDFHEVYDIYEKIQKIPIRVRKDIPGLVANRIQQGVAREVFSLMQMEAADKEDIDKALMFGPAFRYATAGQLEIADMGGLDIWCSVGDNLLSVMDASLQANPLIRQKVQEGKLGLKSGEGFFSYPHSEKQEKQRRFNARLIHQLKASKEYVK